VFSRLTLMLGPRRGLDRKGVYVQGAIVHVLGCVRFRMKDRDLRRMTEEVGGWDVQILRARQTSWLQLVLLRGCTRVWAARSLASS
jgi:hypothetical protein